MLYFLVGILLVIVLIFGVASGMQSYATAQQARAQIEVAQVAQVNAWGNLIVILVLALLIVSALALLFWLTVRKSQAANTQPKVERRPSAAPGLSAPTLPAHALETLIQLETLRLLGRMNGGVPALPPAGPDDEAESNDLSWLR